MALTNAQSIYDYIMSRPVPGLWQTPQSVKSAYTDAVRAENTFQPLINQNLKRYADSRPITQTGEYRNLLDMYNREYQQNAALAAAEAVKASEGMNAGYGDTYSKAATDGAYTGYMADRGAAVPRISAAAADAVTANKAAIAAGITGISNQRDLRTAALQNLFNSRLNDAQKVQTANQSAYNTLISSLADLYEYQYAKEHPTSSGGSGGSGRSGRKSKESDVDGVYDGGNGGSGEGSGDNEYTTIYKNAVNNYPILAGSLLTVNEYARKHDGNIRGYAEYVREQINKLPSYSDGKTKYVQVNEKNGKAIYAAIK